MIIEIKPVKLKLTSSIQGQQLRVIRKKGLIKMKSIMSKFTAIATFALLSLSQVAHAEISLDEVKAKLSQVSPRLVNVDVEKTDVEGVYRFWSGPNLTHFYYADGHIVIGDMLDLARRTSLGDEAKQKRIAKLLNENTLKTIAYGPENPKRVVNVFTDIDCGWCRRLHTEVPKLTAAGVQVRYYAFPRAGLNSESARKYVSVWCSENQQEAMNLAKAGNVPAVKTCVNPIADTFNLGQQVGVRGTPNIILDDGSTPRAGYIKAEDLLTMLGVTE